MVKATFCILSFLFIFSITFNAKSYETDQYSTMFYQLKDSTKILDKIINHTIKEVVKNWKGKKNNHKLAEKIWSKLNGRQLEYWANNSKEIESWNQLDQSIYRTIDWYNSPIIKYRGIAHTISLANIHIGTDKLDHFFNVGFKYFKIVNESDLKTKERFSRVQEQVKLFEDYSKENLFNSSIKTLDDALDYGKGTEHSYWGELTTNVFSNADLVSNYEGLLFYRSLFEDGIISGKKAIIRWKFDRPIIQRKFTFNDHVNDFWNEAIFPSNYQTSVEGSVREVLQSYCLRFDNNYINEKFFSKKFHHLLNRYGLLTFEWQSFRFFLPTICNEVKYWTKEKKKQFIKDNHLLFKNNFSTKNLTSYFNLDLKSPEELWDNLKTGIPFCKNEFKQSYKNHQAILHFSKKYKRYLENKARYFLASRSKTIENLEEAFQAKFIYFDEKYLGIRKFTNSEVKVIYTPYQNICLYSSIPSLSFFDLDRDKKQIDLELCKSIGKPKEETKIRYFVKKEDKSFSSIDIFYDFNDPIGFIYRDIKFFCRWY